MTINPLGEFFVKFQAAPLDAVTPILEETPCPALMRAGPKLAEALLEQTGRMQPLARRKQDFQRASAIQVQALPVRQQVEFLPLDVAPLGVSVCDTCVGGI